MATYKNNDYFRTREKENDVRRECKTHKIIIQMDRKPLYSMG